MHTAVAPQLVFVYIVGAQSAFPPQMLTLKSNLDKIKRYAVEICNDNPDDWKSKETISTLRAFTKKVNAVTREMNKTLNDLYKEHHHRPRGTKKSAPTKKRRITQIEDSDDETDPPAIVDAPPPAIETDKFAAPSPFSGFGFLTAETPSENWITMLENGALSFPSTPFSGW
mgnify:CR=1 FL=1